MYYKEDYLKRQLDAFIRDLASLLSRSSSNEYKLIEIDNLSIKYTNQKINYFIDLETEEIIKLYNNNLDTLEIIADLLLLTPKYDILLKVKKILEHINIISSEYSIIRQNKLMRIEKLLVENNRYV